MRFPEFNGEWIERRFDDIYSFKTTNSYSRERLNYENGEVRNIHYGDIHTKFDSLFDIDKEQVPFINQDVNTSKISHECYLRNGDLVIADASEDYKDIGKTIEIHNLNGEKVVAGLHTLLARRKSKDMANGFASFLIKTHSVRLDIMKIAQGIKVLSISKNRLDKIPIVLPSTTEQTKITIFLTSINERIASQSKIIEHQESLMKGLMQQVFSQELRFKHNDGGCFTDWEFKKAKEIFKNHSNKKHNGDLAILSASQEKGMIFRDGSGIKIQSSEKSVKSYKIVEPGDFVISLRSFQGGLDYSNILGICSPAYTVLKNTLPIFNEFYKYYFKKERFINQLSQTTIGIRDGKQITYGNFGTLTIPYPSVPEQTRIANFFSSLDEKLEKEKLVLKQYQQQKKHLLQNLFI